ncbi:MAG TPA: ribosome-associated translation inhibitor RaiA [Actinomycetes bacterium]|nr:ribosome-associated translation inhibitor RaiA [Actinomycetes bacterium]
MDIVVRARHIEVSDRFREHVALKLAKVERYDGKCHRIDVEVSRESNPRLADHAVRVELTCHGKGPVVRAEASAGEKYAALDVAYSRLQERLRRAADRRHDHHRGHGRAGGARVHEPEVVVHALPTGGTEAGADAAHAAATSATDQPATQNGPLIVEGDGPLVVREKTHVATPMTLDQALYEMELVGHDFFLFQDATSGTPSVVYRRRGYDYGVLHLQIDLAD